MRHPERVKRLFFANTIAGYGRSHDPDDPPQINDSPWFRGSVRGSRSGRTEQVLRNAGSTVLSVMKIIGFQNRAAVDDTWIRAYSAPFPDWDSAIGAYEFPIDAYSGTHRAVRDRGRGRGSRSEVEAGDADRGHGGPRHPAGRSRSPTSGRSGPNAPIVEMPGVGHFCQEDAPEVLVTNLLQFIQANP